MKDLTSYKETDFTEFNFDLPYINHIIEDLNMCRTRVLVLHPKTCYSLHRDTSKRIHIPVVTNEKCWMIVNKEIMHLPADDIMKLILRKNTPHLTVHGIRTHIVGCVKGD